MTLVYALAIAAYVGCGLYMMLSRHLVRVVLGLALLTNGAIFLIFVAGRTGSVTPPVIPSGSETLAPYAANALPQALVLTAIVIGFALTAFAMVLTLKTVRATGSVETNALIEGDGFVQQPAPTPQKVKSHG